MSKVNGMLILPSVLLFLAIEPTERRWLSKPQPYIAAAIAFIVFSPFIWWNHTHGNAFWLHINHMSSRGSGAFTLKYFGDFLAGQALLISPLLFLKLRRYRSEAGSRQTGRSPATLPGLS